MRRIVCAAIILAGGAALADPPGMTCRAAVLVQYFPGVKAAQFDQFVAGHLKFLHEQMVAGNIELAGPDEAEGGGFMVWNTGDLAKVESAVQKDPAVANHAMNYVMHPWKACAAKK
jgi:uncharacterized protein YciI